MLRRRATLGSGRNGVEPKFLRYPSQCPSTLVDELNIGACDEIANRARHQNLACFREGGDASRDVNGYSADIIAFNLDLPGVHPAPDLEVERPNSLHYARGAAHCPRRAIEGRQEPITKCLHLSASEAHDFLPEQGIVTVEKGS